MMSPSIMEGLMSKDIFSVESADNENCNVLFFNFRDGSAKKQTNKSSIIIISTYV